MKVIQNQRTIKRLHNRLMKSMDTFKTEEIIALTGHKGNSFHKTVAYSQELDIWWNMEDVADGKSGERYLNTFGIGKPKENRLTHIICEINYPTSGINKKVAAAWIKEEGEYILVHSGKIAGGRKGIGKNAFKEKYVGEFFDSPIEEFSGEYTAIGSLNDPMIPLQIRYFVNEVARIKKEIVSNHTPAESDMDDPADILKTTFNDEFSGIKQYQSKGGKITSNCNHGLIVGELKKVLKGKGFNIANDPKRDLYIYNNELKITTAFEVKTSMTSQTIYTAIGQLLVNNARLTPLPKLVYVIPEKPNNNLLETFGKLKINTLVYEWKKNVPVFKNIDEIL